MMNNSRGIEDAQQDCFVCGRSCVNRRSLGNHVNRSHPEIDGLMGYTLRFICQGKIPKCICGCGQEVTWHKVLYKFNEYITGHNPAGFKIKQPVLSKEQIDRRNESIRKSYDLRGDEIKEKISKNVSKSLRESGIDFSNFFREKWQDETYKESQRIGRIRSWSGSAGEIRRKKVFTPELSKKISLANMSRESQHKSLAEEKFAKHLESIGLQVERSKWFNFDKKTWCVDIWLPQYETLVEFDGTYWHGLDRSIDYTYDQINNISNDLIKNSIAREKKLNLLRIKEDVDIDSIKSYDDLIESAYHVVSNGAIIKEGSFKLSDDSSAILTRSKIIKMALTADGKSQIQKRLVPLIENFLVSYVDYWGWFYPRSKDELDNVLNKIKKSSFTLSMSVAGSDWLKSRIRSFWEVDGGPVKMFACEKTLRSVVNYRLGINNSKIYTYPVDGKDVECQETFDINLRNIRNGFIVQRNKVSWFKPSWAAYIYQRYCGDLNNPTVWDPSIGFSARLLGFCGVFDKGTYIGTDPSHHMYVDAISVSKEISLLKKHLNLTILNTGSEKWIPEKESLDLVFTSPPYFDSEKYFDEEGQCWKDFPQLECWRENYLKVTLRNAYVGLRHNRNLIINISSKYREVLVKDALSEGFSFVEEIDLKLQKDHFDRESGRDGRAESFLVFKKA